MVHHSTLPMKVIIILIAFLPEAFYSNIKDIPQIAYAGNGLKSINFIFIKSYQTFSSRYESMNTKVIRPFSLSHEPILRQLQITDAIIML